jgi:hypothetical protein
MSDIAPDLVVIGSNGGSTSYAIDVSNKDPARMEFVQIDVYEVGPTAIEYRAASFADLLAHLKTR